MAYNSDYFNLLGWKLTLPLDSNGEKSGSAKEVKNLVGYESASFYDAADHAMVFRAAVDGATTSGSKYARAELREMSGSNLAAWTVATGGTMTATLRVDEVPTKKDGTPGRVVVGQIHGQDDELVRLYWEKGTVYFMNDQAGAKNEELRFDCKNSNGATPKISLGEKFSYKIEAKGELLSVSIYADGQVYTSVTKINSVWLNDKLYFKAGLYLGVNEDSGTGLGQASFYGLDYGHSAGKGLGGLLNNLPSQHDPDPTPTSPDPDPTTPVPPSPPSSEDPSRGTEGKDELSGNSKDNVILGWAGDDTIKGRDGDDHLYGGSGNDKIEGNGDDDVIIGGLGADTIKGSDDADTFVFRSASEGGDTITDWRKEDKLDITGIFRGTGITTAAEAIGAGLLELRQVGGAVEVWVKSTSGFVELASLKGTTIAKVSPFQIILSGPNYERDGFSYGGSVTSQASAGSNAEVGASHSDVLVFDGKLGSEAAIATSFDTNDSVIWLENHVFRSLSPGKLKGSAFRENSTGVAQDGSDRIIYERDTGKLFYDPDGTGPAAASHFATLPQDLHLRVSDFLIV